MDGVQPDGSVDRAWAVVRAHLRESAGARLFDQWLKPMTLLPSLDEGAVRLALPSAFMTNWVRNHYADRLLQEFRAVLPTVRRVSIETGSATAAPAPAVLTVDSLPAAVEAPVVVADRPPLDPRFTFD
ncbi:MAG: chromosomal replication initiator protein, partial [Sphingomonas echinoides]